MRSSRKPTAVGSEQRGEAWDWVERSLRQLTDSNLMREPTVRASPQAPAQIELDGRSLINFSSNDYLGLASDPRLAEAAATAARERGWGSGASPIVTGRGTLHAELERCLADFEGAEDALLFPSGYAANLGALTAIAGKGDQIYSDARNHASIIDGCRLSGAHVHVYAHRDVGHLENLLQKTARSSVQRRVIVTDSLFSMDGCVAPLPELAVLAESHRAMLAVDEAHATGVFGANGRGVCEWLGVDDYPLLRIGTLSKALGSAGGFVTGSHSLIRWLRNRARTQFFSTATPEAVAAASLAALRIVHDEPERRTRLLAESRRLQSALQSQGWRVADDESQIVPVVLGSPQRALGCAAQLRERGFLVPPIRPPAVPEGESLLRISVSFAHPRESIDKFIRAMRDLAAG